MERKILLLAVRFGGLGIANPVENANREFDSSVKISQSLTELILCQSQDFATNDQDSR